MKGIVIILIALALTLLTIAMGDAAAIDREESQSDKIKHHTMDTKNKNKDKADSDQQLKVVQASKTNPHALLASEERFSSCGNPSKDVFRIEAVTSNRHLCSGCKACVDLEGVLKGRIEKGSMVRLEISKYFFTLFDKTYDLCDVLATVPEGPKCPIEPTAGGLRACLPLEKTLTTDVSGLCTELLLPPFVRNGQKTNPSSYS